MQDSVCVDKSIPCARAPAKQGPTRTPTNRNRKRPLWAPFNRQTHTHTHTHTQTHTATFINRSGSHHPAQIAKVRRDQFAVDACILEPAAELLCVFTCVHLPLSTVLLLLRTQTCRQRCPVAHAWARRSAAVLAKLKRERSPGRHTRHHVRHAALRPDLTHSAAQHCKNGPRP